MKKLKSTIKIPARFLISHSPEVLLALFLAFMLPLVMMVFSHLYYWILGAFSDTDTFFEQVIENYPGIIAGALCVVGSVFLTIIFIKERNSLWAVARKMILEALNRKAVIILLLFFVILIPSLPFILETEGSLKSQVQIVLTYSLALAEILLAILAIFFCTVSVCSEINKKQVFITDTKPMKRWQFLAGKLLGVSILCGVLLFIMSGAVYGIVGYMARDRDFSGMPAWEGREKLRDLQRVRVEVLVARHTVRPSIPGDVEDIVERELQRRKERGDLTSLAEEAEIRTQLTSEVKRRRTTAPAGGQVRFTFSGLDPHSNRTVFLRAKPHMTNPEAQNEDERCPGVWYFLYPTDDEAENEDQMAIIGEFQQTLTAGAFQELPISPEIIDPNGIVRVIFVNLRRDTGLTFNPADGIEIMQKTGGFAPNFYRSVLVIFAHIILLAALSIMLGAMFSFPVASFCVAAILVIGLLGPWVVEYAFEKGMPDPDLSVFGYIGFTIKRFFSAVMRFILAVLPQFGRFSPIDKVSNGRLVSLSYTAKAFAVMCFLQGTVAMLLAFYAYWKRELAKVIV